MQVDDNLDSDIQHRRAVLDRLPRPHPLRPCALAGLASSLYLRYLTFRQRDDLDALIPLLTESLLLPISPVAAQFFNIPRMFYKLACSLACQSDISNKQEDLRWVTKYYLQVLALPPEAIVPIDPLEVLGNLARALTHMVQSGNEVQLYKIEEMMGILQKFLSLDPSNQHIDIIAKCLGIILHAKLMTSDWGDECERILNLFTEVEKGFPFERFPELCVLQGLAYIMRFQQTSLYDYYKKATRRFNESVSLLPAGHVLRPLVEIGIAAALHHRFTHDKQLSFLEEAISHSRAALAACPPGHLIRPLCLTQLAKSLKWRYAFFGNEESLAEADACIREALGAELPENLQVPMANAIQESDAFIGGFRRDGSLHALIKEIQFQQDRLAKMPQDDSIQLDVLRSLSLAYGAKHDYTNQLTDLEEELKYHSMALAASPPDHYVRRMSLFSLGKTFQKRFLYDYDVDYLEESIKCCQNALELCPRGQLSRFEPLQTMAQSLCLRYFVFHRRVDFDESMKLFQSAFDEEYANPHAKYEIASHWAACARAGQHPSTALAYEKAMSLAQSSLTIGPTLDDQHRLLLGRWGHLSAIPLQCASYHIEVGSLEKAVECLEQGRALLWSEMRGLRTSTDQLKASKNAELAEQFVAICRELESITTTTSGPQPHGEAPDDHSSPDSFGQMMKKVRTLEDERSELVNQIRAQPDFKDFLKAVPFEALQEAAAFGPVIVINHCIYRCDILIILPNSSPILVPTAEDCYSRATKLKELFLTARTQYGLESSQCQRALRSVLRDLYELVGRPVITKLRELEIPEQSRVWWCPTSVFCSLPVHAAGPIEPEGRDAQYFSDLYISSYTPTLSALIESRKGAAHTLEPPSLLLVAQPDLSLPGVTGEIKVIQGIAESTTSTMTSLIGEKVTRATVMKGISNHHMAHFACHGMLDLERPFNTSFKLGGEERLTLLDILRSRSSAAELAFLSVCHAAEWTDESMPDEALHLTAALQYCGFRSVVGTLWAMADTDGRDLSAHFYRRMFAENRRGVPVGKRSARALRDAVQKLRRKRGMTLERWVNFVHYGA